MNKNSSLALLLLILFFSAGADSAVQDVTGAKKIGWGSKVVIVWPGLSAEYRANDKIALHSALYALPFNTGTIFFSEVGASYDFEYSGLRYVAGAGWYPLAFSFSGGGVETQRPGSLSYYLLLGLRFGDRGYSFVPALALYPIGAGFAPFPVFTFHWYY